MEKHGEEIDKLMAARQEKIEQKREILESIGKTESELAGAKF